MTQGCLNGLLVRLVDLFISVLVWFHIHTAGIICETQVPVYVLPYFNWKIQYMKSNNYLWRQVAKFLHGEGGVVRLRVFGDGLALTALRWFSLLRESYPFVQSLRPCPEWHCPPPPSPPPASISSSRLRPLWPLAGPRSLHPVSGADRHPGSGQSSP